MRVCAVLSKVESVLVQSHDIDKVSGSFRLQVGKKAAAAGCGMAMIAGGEHQHFVVVFDAVAQGGQGVAFAVE